MEKMTITIANGVEETFEVGQEYYIDATDIDETLVGVFKGVFTDLKVAFFYDDFFKEKIIIPFANIAAVNMKESLF